MLPFLLSLFIATAAGLPLVENEPTDNPHVIQLQKDLDLAVFVNNFKHSMAEYITNQHTNLTFAEIEKVKQVLENFLRIFAEDLREVLKGDGKKFDAHETINDGLPDSTFNEIKTAISAEFKDIDEAAAEEIVYRLRKNLNNTKVTIDDIIRESQRAQMEYSLDTN